MSHCRIVPALVCRTPCWLSPGKASPEAFLARAWTLSAPQQISSCSSHHRASNSGSSARGRRMTAINLFLAGDQGGKTPHQVGADAFLMFKMRAFTCDQHNLFPFLFPSADISWDQLPDEVVLRIFFCLPLQDLVRISVVCKRWQRLAWVIMIINKISGPASSRLIFFFLSAGRILKIEFAYFKPRLWFFLTSRDAYHSIQKYGNPWPCGFLIKGLLLVHPLNSCHSYLHTITFESIKFWQTGRQTSLCCLIFSMTHTMKPTLTFNRTGCCVQVIYCRLL